MQSSKREGENKINPIQRESKICRVNAGSLDVGHVVKKDKVEEQRLFHSFAIEVQGVWLSLDLIFKGTFPPVYLSDQSWFQFQKMLSALSRSMYLFP